MSNRYQLLSNLSFGECAYKIKARVIRFWRGSTPTGEDFKGFNIMLLDNKGNTMHAFIPALCAYDMERKIRIGNVYTIRNFVVQSYKDKDKFRCLRNDRQMVFTNETRIQLSEEKGTTIAAESFDFYDHTELLPLTQQTTYLADVVGIIRDREILLDKITNKHGKQQEQAKFLITDGSSNIRVTFWDKFAQEFVKAIWEPLDSPVIIIIANSRATTWNGNIVLTNVGSTKFYLNYKHHSVFQLRTKLADPDFSKNIQLAKTRKPADLLSVAEINNLGVDSIGLKVIAHVTFIYINETERWFFNACTTCDCEIHMENGYFFCTFCNRIVPYCEKRFRLHVLATDATGTIEILLHDREVRSIVGLRARELLPPDAPTTFFPQKLRQFATQPFTVMLEIAEGNVTKGFKLYFATNICIGHKLDTTVETLPDEEIQQQSIPGTSQATTSTTRIQGMSDMNIESSDMSNIS